MSSLSQLTVAVVFPGVGLPGGGAHPREEGRDPRMYASRRTVLRFLLCDLKQLPVVFASLLLYCNVGGPPLGSVVKVARVKHSDERLAPWHC